MKHHFVVILITFLSSQASKPLVVLCTRRGTESVRNVCGIEPCGPVSAAGCRNATELKHIFQASSNAAGSDGAFRAIHRLEGFEGWGTTDRVSQTVSQGLNQATLPNHVPSTQPARNGAGGRVEWWW